MLDVGELFERYHGLVFRRCRALLGNPEDAAEAVQDVFEAALSGLGRFRLRSSPVTWLYAIATRHCLQLLRNKQSRQLTLALLPAPETIADEVAPMRLDLARMLQGLGEKDLELAVYAFRDGMTHEEIAEVSGIPRRTISRRVQALQSRLAAFQTASEPREAVSA